MCPKNQKWCGWAEGTRGHWSPSEDSMPTTQPWQEEGGSLWKGQLSHTGRVASLPIPPCSVHTFRLVVESLWTQMTIAHPHLSCQVTLGQWKSNNCSPETPRSKGVSLCNKWSTGPARKSEGLKSVQHFHNPRLSCQTFFSKESSPLNVRRRNSEKKHQTEWN